MPALQADRKVMRYLNEAHASEQVLATTLSAHIAMTPAGSYRAALEGHLAETRDHASLVRRRFREIAMGSDLLRFAVGLAEAGRGFAGSAVGQALAVGRAPVDLVRRGLSRPERLLENAKDECASEAREIATYDLLEQVALAVGDPLTAELAVRIRQDEERMLSRLRAELPRLAAGAVGAGVEGRRTAPAERPGAAEAAPERARRTGSRAARPARRAAGTGRRSASRRRAERPPAAPAAARPAADEREPGRSQEEPAPAPGTAAGAGEDGPVEVLELDRPPRQG